MKKLHLLLITVIIIFVITVIVAITRIYLPLPYGYMKPDNDSGKYFGSAVMTFDNGKLTVFNHSNAKMDVFDDESKKLMIFRSMKLSLLKVIKLLSNLEVLLSMIWITIKFMNMNKIYV